MKIVLLFFTLLIVCSSASVAQIGTPCTLNAAGGCSKLIDNAYYLDWSFGEESVIQTSKIGTSNILFSQITHGVVQPELPVLVQGSSWDKFSLNLHPNPVSDVLLLDFATGTTGNLYLTLYDVTGRKMMQRVSRFPGGQLTEKITMKSFPAGTYLLWVLLADTGERTSHHVENTYKIIKIN